MIVAFRAQRSQEKQPQLRGALWAKPDPNPLFKEKMSDNEYIGAFAVALTRSHAVHSMRSEPDREG